MSVFHVGRGGGSVFPRAYVHRHEIHAAQTKTERDDVLGGREVVPTREKRVLHMGRPTAGSRHGVAG